MPKGQSNLGVRVQPFPHAKQTKVQKDEDSFMQAHGGLGSRLIYRMVEVFSIGRYRRWAVSGAKPTLKK